LYALKHAVRRISRQVPGYEDAAAYPPVGGFDCLLGEFGAHDVLRGRRRWDHGAELRRAALLIPGVTGHGD
jgi:hypothetical protein